MFRLVQYFFLCLVVFLQTSNSAFPQTTSLSVEDWTKKLSDPNDKENKWYYDLYPVLDKLDSGRVFIFLKLPDNNFSIKGNFFFARFNFFKNKIFFKKNLYFVVYFFLYNMHIKKRLMYIFGKAKKRIV